MMNNLAFASVRELQALLAAKKITATELVAFYRERFATHDTKIRSALEIFDGQSVLADTKASGELAGIPGLIKDNICIQGRAVSCASRILEGYIAPYSAAAIKKLQQEGAFFIGRANMDEFAMGSSTETSAYQITRNPWNLNCVAGGSSGGSIAAVAAGLVPWALGSETGGSVRQPAALCGIVGSKPTYGLVSRFGLIAYASSLDQIGVATRTVYDNALILSIIAGNDPQDATTVQQLKFDFTKDLTGEIRPGLKIGVITNAMHAHGIDPEVTRALENSLEELRKLGATIVPITLPTMEYSAATYFIISRAELASNLARYDGIRYGKRSKNAHSLDEVYSMSRTEGFGTEVKNRILMGNYVLSVGHADEYYNSAKKVQRLMRAEFLEAFKQVDLLFSPIAPTGAFECGAFQNNSLALDLQDYFSCFANLVGIPAVSVPCGFTSSKLPIGFQLLGPDLSEGLIFQTAHAYEQATDWHLQKPVGF
jgi:aspartyl-tRNA(Asn)/glutamyl-tRNA(Gln) amidotransferase subunit A